MDGAALKTIPDIIRAASSTYLGFLTFLMLLMGVLGFYLFRHSAVQYRVIVFALMFAGTAGFGYSALLVQREEVLRIQQREDARRAQAQAQVLPELKLHLVFPETGAANPHRASVFPYVQRTSDGEGKINSPEYLRKDVEAVPGPGGIYLVFSKLAVGDRVYVEVQDQQKRWQSDEMRMPEANLRMNSAEE